MWNALHCCELSQSALVYLPDVTFKIKYNAKKCIDFALYNRQLEDIKASTELRKHIQLGLQDPGVEIDPLDIPYTQVV